jgi:hypothetical protein
MAFIACCVLRNYLHYPIAFAREAPPAACLPSKAFVSTAPLAAIYGPLRPPPPLVFLLFAGYEDLAAPLFALVVVDVRQ